MADGTSVLTIIGSAVGSVAASVVTNISTFKKRLTAIETSLEKLTEAGKERDARLTKLDELFPRIISETGKVFDEEREEIDRRAKEAVNRAVARATSTDLGAAKEAARQAAQAEVRKTLPDEVRHAVQLAGLDAIKRDLETLRSIAEKAASDEEFAEHVAAEAERWGELQRTLGQIEGMLKAREARDRR